MKKKIISIILAAVMLFSLMAATVFASDYTDTQGHWGESAIDRWSGYDIVSGKGGGIFDPDGLMTRGEAAQVFTNLFKLTKKADLQDFTDVGLGKWYDDAIAKCVNAKIMEGCGNRIVDPDGAITREMFFVMFCRALGIKPEDTAKKSISDAANMSDYAKGYITALVNKGFIQGTSSSKDGIIVEPKLNINRASVMSLMDKSIKTYVNTTKTINAGDGVTLVVVDNANVTFEKAIEGAEVYIFGKNTTITNAPVGTKVITSADATGTRVNGKLFSKDTTTIVEKTTPSGGGSYTPPAPVKPTVEANEYGFYYNTIYHTEMEMAPGVAIEINIILTDVDVQMPPISGQIALMETIDPYSSSIMPTLYSVSGNTLTVVLEGAGELSAEIQDDGSLSASFMSSDLDFKKPTQFNNAGKSEDGKYLYMNTTLLASLDSNADSLVIPDGFESIDENFSSLSVVFSNANISTINIPATIREVGEGAFSEFAELEIISIDENNPIFDARNNCNAIIETDTNTLILGCKGTSIPESVTTIGESAFKGCKGLTSIVIPETVTTIGERVFEYCTNLASASVPMLSEFMFNGCTGLTSVTIPESETVIPSCAFQDCTSLASIIIPANIKTITTSAFYGCTDLQTVVFDGSSQLETIGGYAFQNCTNLETVTLPETVTSIEIQAFYNCFNATIIIPDSAVTIESANAFGGVLNIYYSGSATGAPWGATYINRTVLTLDDNGGNGGVDSIIATVGSIMPNIGTLPTRDGYVFLGYYDAKAGGTKYYNVDGTSAANWDKKKPEAILYAQWFKDSNPLTMDQLSAWFGDNVDKAVILNSEGDSYTLSGGIELVENPLYPMFGPQFKEEEVSYCIKKFEDLIIPSSIDGKPVTAIIKSAFMGCNATSIVIPDSVKIIGNSAFASNQSSCIDIPSSVVSIGDSAFYISCKQVITIPASVDSIGTMAFQNNYVYNNSLQTANGARIEDAIFKNDFILCDNSTRAYDYVGSETSVTLPDGVTTLSTFPRGDLITDLTICPSLTVIKEGVYPHKVHFGDYTSWRKSTSEEPITQAPYSTLEDALNGALQSSGTSHFDLIRIDN